MRFPSTQSARKRRVSGFAFCFWRERRAAIHSGRRARSTGNTLTTVPFDPSAQNQADDWPARSRRGSRTSVTASPGSLAQNASIACDPSVPGLPEGRRSSISLRSPKSEGLAALAASWPQSKPRSASSTLRSANPPARARARIASAASMESSGSSPWIAYSGRSSRERCASSCSSRSAGTLFRLRLRGDQPPYDLLDHVGLHVAVQQGLLVLLRDHLRVAVAHVAGEQDLARRH